MKLALTLCLSALALLPLASSWEPASASAQGGGESALAGYMSDLNRSLRKLEEVLDDPKTMRDGLAELCRLQRVVIDAKDEVPSTISTIEDAKKRDKAHVAFRLQMQSLVRALLDAEAGVVEGDSKKVGKALRQLDELKRAGHQEFKPKD